MNEPNAKFQEPFRAMTREMRQSLDQAKNALEGGAEVAGKWPTLKETIIDVVLPTFKSWVSQIRAVIQPAQLKTLNRRKRALERLVGRTWWHPRGLVLRFRIFAYGLLMGLAILLILLLGVGAVVGVVYLVSLVLN